jgi:8-oxo-dGTP diphosphatase
VDRDEHPQHALVRELHEELGIQAAAPTSPPYLEARSDGYAVRVWIIDDWSGDVTNRDPAEHDALTWVDVAAAPGGPTG